MAFRHLATAVFSTIVLAGFSALAPAQTIYQQNFDAAASFAAIGFTTEDLNGATVWTLSGTTDKEALLDFDSAAAHDDWLISPAIALTAGRTYIVSFRAQGGGFPEEDEMDVYFDRFVAPPTSVDFGAATIIKSYDFGAATSLTLNNSPVVERITVTPTLSGNYHFGFHARSIADQVSISVDDIEVFDATTALPEKASVIFPAAAATNVNRETTIYVGEEISANSITVRLTSVLANIGLPASIILNNSSTQLYAEPPALLAANTTYHVRVDTMNANGTTIGDVQSFTTRAVPTAQGNIYFEELFDATHSVSGINPKYPGLPGGFDGLDLDGQINGSNFIAATGFYIAGTGSALSAPNALLTRYNQSGAQNNDWVFLPPVATQPALNSILQFSARVRSAGFPETFEVYLQTTNPASTNPADYGSPIATVTTNSTTHTSYVYSLPANTTVRAAIRYTSTDQSQLIIDNVRASIFSPPAATTLLAPANGATNVNRLTYLFANQAALATSYTIRMATSAADLNLPASILLNNSSTVFHAAPPLLAPATTYFARVDATNLAGTTLGTVTSFTTRAAATAPGDVIGTYSFEERYAYPTVPVTNSGYPFAPRGWDLLDVDMEPHAAGFVSSWYVLNNRPRTGVNALQTRFNNNGAPNDDWVFLPEVVVPANLKGNVQLFGRPRTNAGFPETIEVRLSTTGTNSTNPADYGTLLTTINEDGLSTAYDEYNFELPAGTTSRLALRYVSVNQSQYLIDDVTVSFIAGPIANGDANADGSVNAADVTAIYNFVAGITGAPTGDADVDGVPGVTISDANALVQYLVNGTPLVP